MNSRSLTPRYGFLGLIAAIYILLSPAGAQAQLNASQFAANPQAATIRNLALTNDTAMLTAIVNLERSLKSQLIGASDAQKAVIDAQLAAIGAGIAQAIASNPSTLAAIVSLAQALNVNGGPDAQDQLAAIGTMLGQAVQSNPDLADQVQTALAAAGIPAVNTAYAATTGNTVTAATGGGGGGGIGGALNGGGGTGGGGGNGGFLAGSTGGSSGGGGSLTGGGGGGGSLAGSGSSGSTVGQSTSAN